nr:acid ceramidase 2 [Nephotettix cincticeps]
MNNRHSSFHLYFGVICLLTELQLAKPYWNQPNLSLDEDSEDSSSLIWQKKSINNFESLDKDFSGQVKNYLYGINNGKNLNPPDVKITKHIEPLPKQFDKSYTAKRLQYERSEKTHSKAPVCSDVSYPATTQSKSIKTFKINLDIAPEERWSDVMAEYKNEMKKIFEFYDDTLGFIMEINDNLMKGLHDTLPPEFRRELEGIAKALNTTLGRVTLFNIAYELLSMCTSIVMEGEDGKMYHGRNLDFGEIAGLLVKDNKTKKYFLTEILQQTTIKVDFFKSDKPLYSAVTYAGYIGILTGIKKNVFSLSIDERFAVNGGYMGIIEWALGDHHQSWLGLLTRQVMETAESYDEAKELLSKTPLLAPVYFILAGNTSRQGSIVTRWRYKSDILSIGSKSCSQQQGGWFLVETNYDHWNNLLNWFLSFFDKRLQHAVQCMDEIGRKKPMETLYRVLSTPYILGESTTFTAVMDVQEGRLDVWNR